MKRKIVELTMSMIMALPSFKIVKTDAKTISVERIGGVDRYNTNDKTNEKLDDFSTIVV